MRSSAASDVYKRQVFMGYGELEELIKEYSKKYNNIYFHSAVSPDILLDYTSSADFGISMIEDTCLSYRYCLPNKLFEYIMAEIPVIVSNLYEMNRLVEKYNIGVVAKENNVDGLKRAIERALKLDKEVLKENIKKVKKIFNWENQEKVLLNVYKELEK
jgi:glycosyltransferase involved in cell wall biosynthesis